MTPSDTISDVELKNSLKFFFLVCNKYLSRYSFLLKVSEKTGIIPVFIPLLAVFLLCISLGYMNNFLILIIGFLYPAWKSFKCLESNEIKDYNIWLIHWIIMSLFVIATTLLEPLLCRLYFYNVLKISFFLWLFLPYYKGYLIFYNQCIQPFLINQKDIVELYITEFYALYGSKKH